MNIILVVVVALLVVEMKVEADFLYNRISPKNEELTSLGLKCIPGRTVIRIEEKRVLEPEPEEEEFEEEETRRSHMNYAATEENCQICVCSVEGQDEYCSRRPAKNVNECLRMSTINTTFGRNLPFSHERSLAFRIRRVGQGLDDSKCVPFVSEYSDCSDANACSGCNRCFCDGDGEWKCQKVFECATADDKEAVDDTTLEFALDSLLTNLDRKKRKRGPGFLPVPKPPKPEDDLLLVPAMKFDFDEELKSIFARHKRSADSDKGPVKFYETIDEMNEDTLKTNNESGTLEARKMGIQNIEKLSRRVGILENKNESDPTPLHIKYNQPHEFEQHVPENKVDSKHPLEDKINGLSHEEIHKILGNYSQKVKDKDLSKLVVNELNRGTEVIGDKNVKPLSNITFTPENDTLTAMAFIAGNLLNRLWDMEKDANEGSFEAEEMKHKKINDLLQLFKEPLSLRQETFIKNALEKLSQAIDTNKAIKNMSVCTNFEEINENKDTDNNCTQKPKENHTVKNDEKNQSTLKLQKQRRASTIALNKINEVLSLIKKYEMLQTTLNNLKNTEMKSNKQDTSSQDESIDESVSLNLFGNLLSKITNLLSPNNKNKGINKNINRYHMLRKDNIARTNIEKLFDIDLQNTTFSMKDKMIIDYLENIERHPNCFFSNLQKPVISPLPNIEGNILYNLSEFFKIKSFSDLLTLVKERSYKDKVVGSTPTPTTTNYPNYSINAKRSSTGDTNLKTYSNTKPMKVDSAKDKLKNDLKIILQDLIDLQKERGIKPRNGISIASALPCIYNILNENNATNDNLESKLNRSMNKIKTFIEALKLEMRLPFSRRSNTIEVQRPKSAVVWERAIKNLNKDNKQGTRRNLNQDEKSYKELKEMMNKVDLSSNSYKNTAVQFGVAPSDRLILLRTLQADVEQYRYVLENIKRSLNTVTSLPSDKQNEFKEFVDNAAMNMNLNKKVVNVVEKSINNEFKVSISKPTVDVIKNQIKTKDSLTMPNWMNKDFNDNSNFKLRRDQIINQLITNRLNIYIKTKEETDVHYNADINYNLAKRIVHNLENGNTVLAKELFKVFIANRKPQQIFGVGNQNLGRNQKQEDKEIKPRGVNFLAFREPLIRVEDPNKIKMLNQDYFLKQLWNLKDLRE